MAGAQAFDATCRQQLAPRLGRQLPALEALLKAFSVIARRATRLVEAAVVGRRSVERGYFRAHQPQIHRHLSAMVHPVIDSVADGRDSVMLVHDFAGREQPPLSS